MMLKSLQKYSWIGAIVVLLGSLVAMAAGTGQQSTDIINIGNGTVVEVPGGFWKPPLTAGDYLTKTGNDIDHDVISRVFEVVGCSLTEDETYALVSQGSVTFNGITLCVAQFDNAGGDIGRFHFELPPTFGFGGTTTITMHFWAITDTATAGTVVGSLKAATNTNILAAATPQVATATWATDEVAFKSTESPAITINDGGTAAAGDLCIGEFTVTAASTIDQDPYILVVVGPFSGV